ncbi:MAG: nitrous oxide reductase family maturation protein NosD [Planctomycetota bacterium]|nr:nitrous oxide reductase family maturation protein NosD [Planctomycetota bacterium]
MIRASFILLLATLTGVVFPTARGACGAPLLTDEYKPMSALADLIKAAEPGAIILVPPGEYQGHLIIDKAITLDGRGEVVLSGGGIGTVVEILAPHVTIRSLTIRDSGEHVTGEPAAIRAEVGPVVIESNTLEGTLFGIDIREASGSIIRNNTIQGKDLEPGRRGDGIRLWWSHNCIIDNNTIHGSRDMVFWYSEDLRITNNIVTDSRYGLHFMYSHDTTIDGNVLDGNSVGIYLMYSNRITMTSNSLRNNRGASGYGIGLKDCDDIVVTSNALLANRVGIYVDNSPSSVDSTGLVESNMIAFNEIGLLATPNTHDIVLTGNAFVENEEPAATHGRGQLTSNSFSHDGRGNFWSDYAGFDHDGDGIGDLAYEPRSLFGAMLAGEPNLRLFVHSPAQQAVEFTARALPELRPTPILIDPAPLAQPPTILTAVTEPATNPLAMAAAGFGLLVIAGAAAFALGRQPTLATPAGRSTP